VFQYCINKYTQKNPARNGLDFLNKNFGGFLN
jgi:hypothetical protein